MDEDKKHIIGENISYYMAKNGYSVQQLAREFKVSEDVVHLWTVGARTPNKANLEKMIQLFNTDDFMFTSVRNTISSKGFSYTPLMNKLRFGHPTTVIVNIDQYIPTIVDDDKYFGNKFYLRKDSEDMSPTIFPNSLVLICEVKSIDDIKNGDMVAMIDKNGYYIRRYYKENETVILTADNNNFKPIVFSDKSQYQLAGKVIKIVRDL